MRGSGTSQPPLSRLGHGRDTDWRTLNFTKKKKKSDAVATLGEQAPALASLLRPAQVRAALKANDRLKLYLSVLQAAHAHAHHPREAALDLSREIAAADITVRAEADWLHDLPATAASEADGALRVAARAKAWERHADQLVVHARELAEHQPQWRPLMQLLHHSDDVADALEEACFVLSLLAEHVDATPAMDGWARQARQCADAGRYQQGQPLVLRVRLR